MAGEFKIKSIVSCNFYMLVNEPSSVHIREVKQ